MNSGYPGSPHLFSVRSTDHQEAVRLQGDVGYGVAKTDRYEEREAAKYRARLACSHGRGGADQ